jgi:hypothetical protein
MADDGKKPLFGTSAKPPAESNDTASSTTQKPEGQVSEQESQALSGDGGPGFVPAFGKQQGQDENNNLTHETQLESLKEGASAGSAPLGTELDIPGLVAAQAVSSSEAPEDGSTEFVSTIARLRLGKFQFDGGVLTLRGGDVERFEKLLATAHPRSQAAVRKIDRSAGEAVARAFKAGQMSRGVDTSTGGVPSPKPHA